MNGVCSRPECDEHVLSWLHPTYCSLVCLVADRQRPLETDKDPFPTPGWLGRAVEQTLVG